MSTVLNGCDYVALRKVTGHAFIAGEDCECETCESLETVVEEIVARRLATMRAQLLAAFDPGELDCGRLGLPCRAVAPPDRWCRPCRIRAAIRYAR